jgi:hypothetical protein
MANTASSELSEVFCITCIKQCDKLKTKMQSTRLPVSQCPDQTTLVDRVTNRPIIPGTSHFSAYTSRIPALANIRPAMYYVPFFSAWTVSHSLKVMQKSTVSF